MARSGVKGNRGGQKGRSGRKSKAEEMGLKRLLDECWTVQSRKACIKKLAALARRGDIKSIELLMAYAFGRPKQGYEIAGMDGNDLTIRVVYDKTK